MIDSFERAGSAVKMARLREHFRMDIDRFFHISLKNKYVFAQTPKVASSTLKSSLTKLEITGTRINASEIGLHPTIVQSAHVKPYQLPEQTLSKIFFGKSFFRFCFVRHPYSRVLSAYLDKIVRNEPAGARFRKEMGVAEDYEVSYETFLLNLKDQRSCSDSWDPHWRPQFSLLRPDEIKYHLIGKLERFDADFENLDKHLGGKLGAYQRQSPHRTDANSVVERYMTKKNRKIIDEIYQIDFEMFDYND